MEYQASTKTPASGWPRWSLILFLALVLRWIFAFSYAVPIYSDMAGYHKLGQQLSQGWLEGSSYWPPLYPAFLALIYSLFGTDYLVTRLIQALISALSCILIYRIGSFSFDEQVGWYAALIACFYFPFIAFSGVLMTENQYMFCLLLTIYALLCFQKSRRKRNLILAGVTGGLGVLTRGSFLAFLPLVFVWLAGVFPRQRRLIVKYFTIYSVTLILTITPALVRSYLIHRRFIFISYNGGASLYIGTGGTHAGKDVIRRQLSAQGLPHAAEQGVFYKLALERIKANPWGYVKGMGIKLRKLYLESYFFPFYPTTESIYWLLKFSQLFFILILCPLTLGSLWFLPPEKYIARRLFWGVIIFNTIFHFVFFGKARYRLPTDPCFIILATYCAREILNRWKGNKKRRQGFNKFLEREEVAQPDSMLEVSY